MTAHQIAQLVTGVSTAVAAGWIPWMLTGAAKGGPQ